LSLLDIKELFFSTWRVSLFTSSEYIPYA
jgi:hypothetical protein